MPIVHFDDLPDSARVWIFASDVPLAGETADLVLASVDAFLAGWKAHGVPLRCARDWRDGRFLAVGVDVTAENASFQPISPATLCAEVDRRFSRVMPSYLPAMPQDSTAPLG